VEIAGTKTEGKQGEINNMPQWVGKILSENNLVNNNWSEHNW